MSLICMVDRKEAGTGKTLDTIRAIQITPTLAVHKTTFGWRITHIPTGYRAVDCCCIMRAIALAEHIATLLDWTLSPSELEASARRIELGKIIRQFPCPDDCTRKEEVEG
jgi:hypothetical protein